MNWYCIHAKPQKEAQVATYCRDSLGVETYYPRLRQTKTIRRVRRSIVTPLFPRYLFCRFDLSVSYRAIRYAPDVLDLVHAGSQPAIVTDTLIEDLHTWAGDEVDVITLAPPLKTGDTVEVIAGPLRGFSAVILHTTDDRDRVAVLLSILQSSAQLTVSRSQIRRIG